MHTQTVSVLDQVIQDLDRLFPQQVHLSIEETAKAIGLHPLTLRNQIAQKVLPFASIKIGSRRLVQKRELAKYLADLTPFQKLKRGAPTKRERIARAAAEGRA